MGMDLNLSGELKKCLGHAVGAANHDLDKQRLRILRCTALHCASHGEQPGRLAFQGRDAALAGRTCRRPAGAPHGQQPTQKCLYPAHG